MLKKIKKALKEAGFNPHDDGFGNIAFERGKIRPHKDKVYIFCSGSMYVYFDDISATVAEFRRYKGFDLWRYGKIIASIY